MTASVCEGPVSEVAILSAHPSEYTAVTALIIQGLTARWGTYDASVNPDLLDFANCYRQAVILVAKIDGVIIGCGVLVKDANAAGRIVRMTVRADRQRTGVGRKILDSLLEAAKTTGYRVLLLETTSTWKSAVAFYTACGFVPGKVGNGDQQFCLVIDPSGPEPT